MVPEGKEGELQVRVAHCFLTHIAVYRALHPSPDPCDDGAKECPFGSRMGFSALHLTPSREGMGLSFFWGERKVNCRKASSEPPRKAMRARREKPERERDRTPQRHPSPLASSGMGRSEMLPGGRGGKLRKRWPEPAKDVSVFIQFLNPSWFPCESGELVEGVFGLERRSRTIVILFRNSGRRGQSISSSILSR